MSNYYNQSIECATREQMEQIQSAKLHDMVARCYNKVPFYKQLFDQNGIKPEDITSIKDITKLPFTVKQDLRDNYPYGLLAASREELTRVHASSGTTGKQTVVAYTKNDLDIWAESVSRAFCAYGVKKTDFVHIAYGYGLFTGGIGIHYGAEKYGATAIPVSSGNTKRQVQILQDFQSDVLCCTPSYAMFLAETCRDMGVDTSKLPVRIGVFGAETWSEDLRLKIEEGLNIQAYDIYGLSEISGPGVAFDCPEHNGLHINEDYFYPEIIDPDTDELLPDGQVGELVFTCIGKEALPLVRYRTRDLCSITHEKCACGRTLVRMSKIQGRSDDMLVIRGVNVFPSQIEHVLLQNKMEPNFQIIVDRINNLDTIEILVEMSPDLFSDKIKSLSEIENSIRNEFHTVLNIMPKVKLVEPKSLERFDGKAIRVIDKRK